MNMIQVILIAGLLIFIIWSLMKTFTPWLKLLAVFAGGSGIFFVLNPSVANSLAHSLNVGRGADLMLYFFIMLMFFSSISVYRKMKEMQNQITRLFRDKAKKEGKKLS